jgi:hypothetical protein
MNLIPFKDDVVELIEILEEIAADMKKKFDQKESIEVIRAKLEIFSHYYEKLTQSVDLSTYHNSSLNRHVTFLNRYIGEGKTERCESDIESICSTDLKYIKDLYIKNLRNKYIDYELDLHIGTLIKKNELDSAVRKAFLTLTERLRSKYNIPKDKDGVDLVNLVFGKNGKSNIDGNEKESLRNLISGLYGVFRNDFMHNLTHRNKTEVSTIYMINTVLWILDEIDKTK